MCDTKDPRTFAIRGNAWPVIALTSISWLLPVELEADGLTVVAAHYEKAGAPRGEVTLLVGPPGEVTIDNAKIDAALTAALAFMPVKAAANMIADLTDGSRKTIYARALELKDGD